MFVQEFGEILQSRIITLIFEMNHKRDPHICIFFGAFCLYLEIFIFLTKRGSIVIAVAAYKSIYGEVFQTERDFLPLRFDLRLLKDKV